MPAIFKKSWKNGMAFQSLEAKNKILEIGFQREILQRV